jgi:drug/metabolite transporter (DMT)-like permease
MSHAEHVPLPRVSMPVATALVVLASVGFGLVPFFARSLTDGGMAPPAVALWRYALGALIFLPVVWAARRHTGALAWGFGGGFAVGVGWIFYVQALAVLPVAVVGVVYMTFPAFAALFSWMLFGERPTARGIVAAGVVLVAAALASGRTALAGEQGWTLALALLSPATFGLAISILVHRLTALPVLARLGVFSLGSVLGLAPLVATLPAGAVMPPDAAALWLVAGIALGTALVPQLLYTFFAPVVGSARAATAGAIELPVMILAGWLMLGESVSAPQWLACAMIAGAIALSPSRKVRGATVTAVTTPREPRR